MSEHTKGRLRVYLDPAGFSTYNDSCRIESEQSHRHPQSFELGVQIETRTHIAYCSEPISGQGAANARRIVACWNACEGISTEDLELNLHPGAAPSERDRLKAVNDGLVKALRGWLHACDHGYHGDINAARVKARAALSRATETKG